MMHTTISFALFLAVSFQGIGVLPTDFTPTPEMLDLSIATTSLSDYRVEAIQEPITMTVTVTGYSSTPDQTDDDPFIAASGKHVYDGMIASNFLAFGTKVKIPSMFGDKIFTVDDRMNKRYFHNIDVWFPDRASAKQLGRRELEIVILN